MEYQFVPIRNTSKIAVVAGLLLLLFVTKECVAQKSTAFPQAIREGNYCFDNYDYDGAIKSFLWAYKRDSFNASVNYKIGVSYLLKNNSADRITAISYLTKAKENITENYREYSTSGNRAPVISWMVLGEAYRLEGKLDSAIICYSKYIEIAPKKDKDYVMQAHRELASCKRAEMLMKYPKTIEEIKFGIANLKDGEVQSCPVISGDKSTFVYSLGNMNVFPPDICIIERNDEYETDAIYWSEKEGSEWTIPKSILIMMKISQPAMPVSLNRDGTKLLIVQDDIDDGNIYLSTRKGDRWSVAKKLNKNINSRRWETHAVLSSDEKTLFFTSERKGGYGGLDIYKSELDDKGEWGPAQNLGPVINTEWDEETPYLTENGNMLYFSSQGHYSIGGHDVFCSRFNGNQWMEPMNLGYPYNTTGNDLIYLVETEQGLAMAPMNQRQSFIGEENLNLFYLNEPEPDKNQSEFEIVATLTAKEKKIAFLPTDSITIIDSVPGLQTKTTKIPIHESRISFVLTPGDHHLTIVSREFADLHHDFSFPPVFGRNSVQRDFSLVPKDSLYVALVDTFALPVDSGLLAHNPKDTTTNGFSGSSESAVTVTDLMFGFDKSATGYYGGMLDSLAKALKEDPEAVIRLVGYADAVGDANYNIGLSYRRADFVKNELLKRGVSENQILVEGKGEANPIASNSSPESRKYNRRVEVEIVKAGKGNIQTTRSNVPEKYSLK